MTSFIKPEAGTFIEVREEFLKPLKEVMPELKTRRACPAKSDEDWMYEGIERVISSSRSGRDFIQTCLGVIEPPALYFQRLASDRRLEMVMEGSEKLKLRVDRTLKGELDEIEALKDFEVYTGDGHYLEHAVHDKSINGTYWATGHFFAQNLKSQSLIPFDLADRVGKKKEHDIRMLKRQEVKALRMGAGVGKKVIWVWDKAGVDLTLWTQRKCSGIYFISMKKENQCLELIKEREIDFSQEINQGVVSDLMMKDRQNNLVRQVTFENPLDGKRYVYLTTEMTLEPGIISLLYKIRWEIEKVFDETKTKLEETKSWATSDTAKKMQAHFVAMTHNLFLIYNRNLKNNHGIENVAELERRKKREKKQNEQMLKKDQPVPLIYRLLNRFTQASFKLIRWLRSHWRKPTSPEVAYATLRSLYAKL